MLKYIWFTHKSGNYNSQKYSFVTWKELLTICRQFFQIIGKRSHFDMLIEIK